MIEKAKIEKLATDSIGSGDTFLIAVNCTPDNNIEITVDSDDRMTIDQCIQLSKTIEAQMDREVEDFSLTVTSAGIGQPLTHPRQYNKTVGKPIEVVLKSGGKITGTLTSYAPGGISLEYQTMEIPEGKKRKEAVTHTENYTFDQIKSVKEEITIK